MGTCFLKPIGRTTHRVKLLKDRTFITNFRLSPLKGRSLYWIPLFDGNGLSPYNEKSMKGVLSFLFIFAFLASFARGRVFVTPYEKIVERMKNLRSHYPHLLELVSLGANDQGIEVMGLRIERPEARRGKVSQLLVGTHHGDERGTSFLSLAFAERILGTFDRAGFLSASPRDVIQNHIYYIFPVLNISGYNRNSRRERDGSGRWHDSNRDYPDPCKDHKFFKLKSTALLASFIEKRDIVSAVTIHAYGGTFTYPWGFHTEDPQTPDNDLYHALLTYAAQVNGYRVGNHKDVIYPASGSFEDWVYYEHGVWVALLEMRSRLHYLRDVESLIRFFAGTPERRSSNHKHYGQCSEVSPFFHGDHYLNISRP